MHIRSTDLSFVSSNHHIFRSQYSLLSRSHCYCLFSGGTNITTSINNMIFLCDNSNIFLANNLDIARVEVKRVAPNFSIFVSSNDSRMHVASLSNERTMSRLIKICADVNVHCSTNFNIIISINNKIQVAIVS